jgi:hypothetical protein
MIRVRSRGDGDLPGDALCPLFYLGRSRSGHAGSPATVRGIIAKKPEPAARVAAGIMPEL